MTKGQIYVSYLHQASLPALTLDGKITITFLHTHSTYNIIHIPSDCLKIPTTHSDHKQIYFMFFWMKIAPSWSP